MVDASSMAEDELQSLRSRGQVEKLEDGGALESDATSVLLDKMAAMEDRMRQMEHSHSAEVSQLQQLIEEVRGADRLRIKNSILEPIVSFRWTIAIRLCRRPCPLSRRGWSL